MPHVQSGSKPRRQWAPDARALSIVGDRWVMVIVRDLASGPLRLDTVRRWLPGVSAGALEARLVRMAQEGLIVRRRRRSLPPRVDLELTDRGHALVDAIAALARWELRTHWSAPHPDEWVDVGACFRLAPFLEPREDARAGGTLALTILDEHGTPSDQYAYVRDGARTIVAHRAAPDADASAAGTEATWVQALSPEGTAAELRITGRRSLATGFLRLFAADASS
jgi:DNA-binding HxlR family transcriptional regulator